jgi:hypothetical protein
MHNIIILTKTLSIYSKKFKKMVTEMLLNNDIRFIFCSNHFKLFTGIKCNYVNC